VGGIGLIGCVVSFVLGFVPPSQLKTGNPVLYMLMLALAVLVLSAPPFVIRLIGGRGPAVAAIAPLPGAATS
jgi:hypothetical protein